MAEVNKGDRERTGFSDGSFPVSTHAQALSAIKLRHNSNKHSAASVLAHIAAAARSHGWRDILEAVKNARIKDEKGS